MIEARSSGLTAIASASKSSGRLAAAARPFSMTSASASAPSGAGPSMTMKWRTPVRAPLTAASRPQRPRPEQTTTEAFVKRVEESLRRLQTDHVDIAMLHAVDDPAALRREEVLAAHDRLKRDGKIRFSGFSTHQPARTLPEAIQGGRFDVVLMTYNHLESAATEPLIARAREGVQTRLLLDAYGSHAVSRKIVSPLAGAGVDAQNHVVMALYPRLKALVQESENALYTATKLAILGNAIDFMVPQNMADIEKSISDKLDFKLDQREYETLEQNLSRSKRVLYFADNCGEIVLDKLFMETVKGLFGIDFVLVVKSVPAMNDVTLKEARAVGMDGVAAVIENGIQGPVPGTILSRCSERLKQEIGKADLFISKGGGNFDTLDEEKDHLPRPIVFMLLSKCRPYFKTFGVEVNRPILWIYSGGPER